MEIALVVVLLALQLVIVNGHVTFTQESQILEDEEALSTAQELVDPKCQISSGFKKKRCPQVPILRASAQPDKVLSMNRRDLSEERRKIQCERCKNTKLCKSFKHCKPCNRYCDNESTTLPPTISLDETIAATELIPVNNNGIVWQSPERFQTTDKQNEVTVGSRFKESDNANVPQYYTLGVIDKAASMDSVLKMLNKPKNEFIQKLIVVAQSRNNKGGKPVVVDSGKAFGETKEHVPVVASVVPENKNDLNEKLNKSTSDEGKKSEHNIDDMVEAIMTEAKESQVTTLAPETQTKCSEDEGFGNGPNFEPPQIPARVSDNAFQQPQPEEAEGRVNPPVIEDEPEVGAGQKVDSDALVDDNQEAQPTVGNNPINSDERAKVEDPKSNVPVKDPSEPEIIEMSAESNQQPESSNQLIEQPTHETRANFDPNREIAGLPRQDSSEDPNFVVSTEKPSILEESFPNQLNEGNNLQDSAIKAVEDISKGSSDAVESQRKNLEDSIMKVVKDSLKVVPKVEEGANAAKGEGFLEQPAPSKQKSAEEIEQPIISENRNAENVPSQANADPTLEVIKTAPSLVNETPNILKNNPEISPEVEARTPDLNNQDQFMESEEKYNSFGKLIQVPPVVLDSPIKNVMFIGKGIKLPLQVYEGPKGELELAVDMDKLCHCKNKGCTRKHENISGTIVEEDLNSLKEKLGEVTPTNVESTRKVRHKLPENELNRFVETLRKSAKTKRSANIETESNLNKENFEEKQSNYASNTGDLNPGDEKLEDKLEKLSSSVKKFEIQNEKLLNKGTVAVYRNIEKVKNVERMVDLANILLSWMKEFMSKQPNN